MMKRILGVPRLRRVGPARCASSRASAAIPNEKRTG
jgi:hypothetical protein